MTFTAEQLTTISDMANAKADALRGYCDANRNNLHDHYRAIATAADAAWRPTFDRERASA